MTPIQETICDYIRYTDGLPGTFTMQTFVGMIETGEATLDDFQAAGGDTLAAAVANTKQNMDDARDD
jgi:hypothetical protein